MEIVLFFFVAIWIGVGVYVLARYID